ncbi:putative uncharacterized protein BRD3OS [Salarias fasciatus]|uniref:putative uncharacterized protein BRD3OS n=1 Tax=Salarias fasciatus TaxID=181472 RepID=UPI001176FF6C|nr:putative uncharacterized protein BRD3OS [Salarias fasciatus]
MTLWSSQTCRMSESEAAAGTGPAPGRPPLAQKALSEAFCGLRYRDTSLLVWQQQQLQVAPPATYLSRSQSAWYSSYGNQAVLVRDQRALQEVQARSRICRLM